MADKTVPAANALTSASIPPSDTLQPADRVEASGALQEPTISDRVDTTHPAVDDEPRKGLPAKSNQIDFNDPTISGAEAVRRNLEEQGIDAGPAAADVSRKD